MTLLIDIRDPDWMTDESLRDTLQPLLPGVEILCGDPGDRRSEITMLAGVTLFPDSIEGLTNLKLVQKLGAGVDGILKHTLPDDVRVCRLRADIAAWQISEYCIGYVLERQRHLRQYHASQQRSEWSPVEPRKAAETTVGVLGLGHIGQRIAAGFTALGFEVVGWRRGAARTPGVETLTGDIGLKDLLARAHYVVSILPSTPETRGLFDADRLAQLRSDATLINVGRGDLINEPDLIRALDNGQLAAAVLDVVGTEPLPADSPLWQHPGITITPHVSGWHIDGGLDDVASNYLRLTAGETLLHEVDRNAGY